MNRNLSCLLVSSQPGDRVLVEEALGQGSNHLQIEQATDVSSWQQALEAGDFNLVFMAEAWAGLETSAAVKDLKSRRPECPLILLAAPAREEAAWEALGRGVDDYVLTSPEEMRRLPAVVQAARHRARQPAAGPLETGAADFQTLFDAVPQVILMHDPETGGILDANQEACRVLGYTREEFRKLNLGTISLGQPPYTQQEGLQIISKTVQEGPQTVEWLGRDRLHRPLWAKVNLKCLVLGGQKRVLSFARNISAVKQTEEALQEAERRYETLLDNAGDAIFIHDTAGRLLQVNDAASKLLGYSRAELQQMTLKDINAPDHPLPQKIWESRLRGHVFVETALRRRDGAAVSVELSSRLMEYGGLPVAFSIARDITERKEAEEKLRQSEILYRSIFETTGTATCISDENTVLRLVNDECTRLTGYSREELEGKKSWTEFIVPEDLERLKEYHRLRRSDSEAAPQSYTLRWADRQGRTRDMLVNISLIPGTKNTLASLLDITAQQQAEKALRESEERYRLLVETMNDGLGMQDEKGVITLVNQKFCEMIGYPREELLNRPLQDFLDTDNQKILQDQRQRRQQGERQTYELTWTRKDGAPLITSISPVPLFDAGGKFQGSFAVIADISSQRQAEQALRESEEKYRAIFENSGTAMAIVDADHTLSLVNAEFAELSGYSREEIEGKKTWMEFAAAVDLPKMQEYHRLRRIDPHLAPRNYEVRFMDRQGQIKDMLMTAGMIPGTNKSVGSLLDITARKKAEQKLEYERKKLQVLTQNSPSAMVLIGQEGKFKYVNPKFVELFGYDLTEVPDGKTWFQIAYPDAAYRHEVISAWVNDLERAKPREIRPRTFTVTCKDGSLKIVRFNPLELDNGDNLMTCEDFTEQHLAVEAVKQSEQRFRLLMENSMVHLAIIDAQGTVLYENPTMERVLGYEIGELKGTNAFEFIHPEDLPRGLEIMRQLLESPGTMVTSEVRYRHKDGSWRLMEIKAKNLLTEPVIQGIVINTQDITERKQAEEAVKQSEQRFRLLIENSMFHLRIIDPDGTIRYESPTLERFMGYEPGEQEGFNAFDFLHPDDHPLAGEKLGQLLENPGLVMSAEMRYRHRDGTWRWLDIKGKNLLHEPLINGIVLNGQDITERKQAEEAVKQSEQRFRLLMENSMSHLAIINAQGTILYETPTIERTLGYDLDELMGRSSLELIHPEDQALSQETLAKLLESPGTVFSMVLRFRHKDGSWRFLEVKTKNLLDEPLIRGIVVNAHDITPRLKALEALRESEELHSRILDTMPDVVYEISVDGQVIYANRVASEILGYAPEEMLRLRLEDLLDAEGLAHAHRVIREMMETRQPSRIEYYQLRPAQGGSIPIETRAIPVARSNQPPTIVGVARDISERLQAEEALRRSEAEKSLILKNMSDRVAYYDRDNRIIWANQAMADFAGISSEEMVGHFCYEIFQQRQSICPDCPVIQAMETGQPVEIEKIKPDGKIFLYRSTPVRSEDREIQGNVLLIQDITARKKVEEAIKASEEKMRLVIESSPVGIRITQQGRHIYVNPALVQMFGYGDPEELVGTPVDLLFAADASAIPEKMQVKPAPWSYEARGLRKDASTTEVQVWQTAIDYHGDPALLDFVLDISEAKDLRNQLLQAQKMEAIGTLAGGIAHDFNNILFPILVNAEMILESLTPDSPLKRRIERVFKACERAIDLVKQILAFSRQEERELSLVRLTPIIDDSLRLLRPTLPTTIEMRQHLDGAADTVLADPTQIQQVLINLYTNAAHALRDRGGVIDISLRRVDDDQLRGVAPSHLGPGPYLQLTVKDNGHGMDLDTKERIFDPYFTTKKPGEGTGLGLAIVHGIIKRHGGAIAVESALGQGSSFQIFLPRVEGKTSKETRRPIPLPRGRERIMLVDDEAEIVDTLQQMLESLGYQVAAFTGSAAALEAFRTRPEDFDLVITDQTMPHLTGEELAGEMLNLRPDLPIILCTGFSEAISPEKSRAMGIREFIIKPIAARVMADSIRRALTPGHDLG